MAAVALAVEATRHAARVESTPIVPHGAWKAVWVGSVLAALALGGIAVLLARRGSLRLSTAVAVAVAIQLVPLLGPTILSQDVFLYWAEARVITVHHANPFSVPPIRYPNDPATKLASAEWRRYTEPYGPAWAAVGTLPALIAGRSAELAQLLYRVLAAAGVLALIGMIAVRTRSAAAVALLGWSPLVALHFAGGGHSDALMMLLVLVGLTLGARAVGGVAWPAASMFKGFAAVLLPLDLACTRGRRPRRFWIGLVAGTVVVLAAAITAFGMHWVSANVIAARGSSGMGGVHFITSTGLRHRYAVVIGGLVFVTIYLVLLRDAWRRGRPHLGFAAAALCMCSSLLRPWYGLWPLALAAVEEDGISELAAYALAAYLLVFDALPT
jgi:alpha-1,6-mannosyltransferase